MASPSRTRRIVGDALLVGGILLVIGAQAIDQWWWFLSMLLAGISMCGLSFAVVPLKGQLARLGRAPFKDESHELNIPTATENRRKDAI